MRQVSPAVHLQRREEAENELFLQASHLGVLYLLGGVQNASEEGTSPNHFQYVLVVMVVVLFGSFAHARWKPEYGNLLLAT